MLFPYCFVWLVIKNLVNVEGCPELPEGMVIVACLTVLFALQGKLHRSFRAWKSFKLKSVRDKTLRNKACDHHEKTLLGKAVLAWKGYIHLCFRIKVSHLCASFPGQQI